MQLVIAACRGVVAGISTIAIGIIGIGLAGAGCREQLIILGVGVSVDPLQVGHRLHQAVVEVVIVVVSSRSPFNGGVRVLESIEGIIAIRGGRHQISSIADGVAKAFEGISLPHGIVGQFHPFILHRDASARPLLSDRRQLVAGVVVIGCDPLVGVIKAIGRLDQVAIGIVLIRELDSGDRGRAGIVHRLEPAVLVIGEGVRGVWVADGFELADVIIGRGDGANCCPGGTEPVFFLEAIEVFELK